MGEQTKNMLIGVFVIMACVVTVSLIMFLKPSVGDGKETLYVRFSNIMNIGVGTRVYFAGKAVGEVVAVDEIYDARSQPTDIVGTVYYYQLTLHVDSSVKVFDTDQVALQTSGLLGEKSIVINPKTPPKGVTPKQITTQPIYAESVDPIQNAFLELSELANDMQETFRRVTNWIDENGDSMGDTIRTLNDTLGEAKIALADVNNLKVIEEVKDATHNFSCAMARIDQTLCEFHDNNTIANIGITMENFKNASRSIDITMQEIADGQGTIGKWIKNDDLYLQVNAIMSKVNTMMNDVNHYGILFHLNKQWQRMRLQRVDLMNALNTPESFKDYFEKEVDQINMSMSRLSMVLDKAEASPQREAIMESAPFKKDFSELMRQAAELADNLRLYNEQLQEMQLSQ